MVRADNQVRLEMISAITQRFHKIWNGPEPAVTQAAVNGWQLSWNPDDKRWYVERPDVTAAAAFKEFRNATNWARKHKVPA